MRLFAPPQNYRIDRSQLHKMDKYRYQHLQFFPKASASFVCHA